LALTLAGLCGHHHQPARGERSEAERPGSAYSFGLRGWFFARLYGTGGGTQARTNKGCGPDIGGPEGLAYEGMDRDGHKSGRNSRDGQTPGQCRGHDSLRLSAPEGRFSSWYSYFLFQPILYQGLKRAGMTYAAPAGQHTALPPLALSQGRAASSGIIAVGFT